MIVGRASGRGGGTRGGWRRREGGGEDVKEDVVKEEEVGKGGLDAIFSWRVGMDDGDG